eukprot:33852-Pleurochrysis_carterae.AAC.3
MHNFTNGNDRKHGNPLTVSPPVTAHILRHKSKLRWILLEVADTEHGRRKGQPAIDRLATRLACTLCQIVKTGERCCFRRSCDEQCGLCVYAGSLMLDEVVWV